MKFVKLSIVALTLGLFITSCGNSENKDAATTDSTTMEAAPAPEATPAPAPADTTAAPAADTTKAMENK